MKFLFAPQGCLPIHGNSLEERPLGGTEAGLIYLAQELSDMGHDVVVLTNHPNPPLPNLTNRSPSYVPFQTYQPTGPVDVMVAIREWMPLMAPLPARYRFFWTGDSFDQPQNLGIGDRRVARRIDRFLAVSEWHKRTLCKTSRFPEEKAYVIRNGIKLDYFAGEEERHRKRLIYSSTPYRGLQLMPEIFPRIREQHPDAELHAFSGFKVYAGANGFDPRAEAEFNQLSQKLEKIPGIVLHGNVTHRELAREFMKSSILCYPNTFLETSCITAMEAQAAGCAIVSSRAGALPETVGNAGILIPGDPRSPSYQTLFVDAVCQLLSDDKLFHELSQNARRRAQELDWRTVAERLIAHIDSLPVREPSS